VQETDAEAAVREVSRIVRAPPTQGNLPKTKADSAATAARVDIAGVLGRIRTPAFALEYLQLEASTLALQTKTDQHLATLRSLERACAPDREVAAASRTLGESEYAYDYSCWRLRMKALTALAGASPVAQLTWPERIAVGFHRDRSMRDYTDEDVVVIAANVQARLSPPSA
jgi:hypothetical protein